MDISDSTQSPNGSTLKITITDFFATVPAPVNVTSASATALAVGRLGATTPAFTVDASTASQVAGLKVTGAATGGTVAVVVTDSGSNANLTINAKGSGTIGIGSVSTGAVTITPATTHVGLVTSTASQGFVVAPTTATDAGYLSFSNTGGAYNVGADNSVGGLSGTAYALALYAPASRSVVLLSGGAVALTLNASQAATFAGTLAVTGDFAVATTKFTVAASSGNTVVAGTLGVTGDFAVATSKFTVAAASGNTVVAGTLGVTGTITAGIANFSGAVDVASDFSVATSKFTVAAASGNTVVAGTLDISGTTNVTDADFAVKNGIAAKFSVSYTQGDVTIAGFASITGNVGINGPKSATSPLAIFNLPTSSAGLSTGDIWRNGNVLTYVP